MPPDEFTAQAGEFCEKIKATPTADGYNEVLVPGEPEMRARGELTEGQSETFAKLLNGYVQDLARKCTKKRLLRRSLSLKLLQ